MFLFGDKAYKAETVSAIGGSAYEVTTVGPLLEEVFADIDIDGDIDFSGAVFRQADPTATKVGRSYAQGWKLPKCVIDTTRFGTSDGGEASCEVEYAPTTATAVDFALEGKVGFKRFKALPVQYSLPKGTSTVAMTADLVVDLTAKFTVPAKVLQEVEFEVGAIEVAIPGTLGLVRAAIPLFAVVEPKLTAGPVAGAQFKVPLQARAVSAGGTDIQASGSVGRRPRRSTRRAPWPPTQAHRQRRCRLVRGSNCSQATRRASTFAPYQSIISAGAYAKGGYDIRATAQYDPARAAGDNLLGTCIDATGSLSMFAGGEV